MAPQGSADPLIVGFTYIDASVAGASGEPRALRFVVDSGAKYTVLPNNVWHELGLAPQWTATFVLADGTNIERAISECWIALGDRSGHTPVVLGEPGDVALLGVITLEEFGLILNPFNRTLQPARMLLAHVA